MPFAADWQTNPLLMRPKKMRSRPSGVTLERSVGQAGLDVGDVRATEEESVLDARRPAVRRVAEEGEVVRVNGSVRRLEEWVVVRTTGLDGEVVELELPVRTAVDLGDGRSCCPCPRCRTRNRTGNSERTTAQTRSEDDPILAVEACESPTESGERHHLSGRE